MYYDLLLNSIAKHISLTGEEEQAVIAVLSLKKVKKKQFIFQEGDIARQAIFVISGCLRSYSIDKNGFEHILQFAPAGWWISDMRSMIHQEPGILYIDAVDNSEVILIQKTTWKSFIKQCQNWNAFFAYWPKTRWLHTSTGLLKTSAFRQQSGTAIFVNVILPLLNTCLKNKWPLILGLHQNS